MGRTTGARCDRTAAAIQTTAARGVARTRCAVGATVHEPDAAASTSTTYAGGASQAASAT